MSDFYKEYDWLIDRQMESSNIICYFFFEKEMCIKNDMKIFVILLKYDKK